MKFRVEQLSVVGTHGPRTITFAEDVTFIHGAMGAGKSTIARLIDYCLGGELERTPALRESFVVAKTHIRLENVHLILERGATEASSVRATWENDNGDVGSANVPIRSGSAEILPGVFNLSDLMYSLCGETPLRIRRSKQDPDSPLIRLGFRELFRFCYLPQDTLDSSFYKLDDTLTGRSRDAMRFIVGLFSDRLNELEADLQRSLDDQRASRIAVEQVRRFLRGYGVCWRWSESAAIRWSPALSALISRRGSPTVVVAANSTDPSWLECPSGELVDLIAVAVAESTTSGEASRTTRPLGRR